MSYHRKPETKWAKSYITNVFKAKNKYQNTFSEILLSETELLSKKQEYMPSSLFKFYGPNSNNILDIQKRVLWLSHPNSFNDPFDCSIGYDDDAYERATLIDFIKDSGFASDSDYHNGFTEDEFHRICNSKTFNELYGWYYNTSEEFDSVLRKILNTKSKDFSKVIDNLLIDARSELKDKIGLLRDANIRVSCFSNLNTKKGICDVIHMWSHYADNHKGFCVEYDTSIFKAPDICELSDYSSNDDFLHGSKYTQDRLEASILGGLFPVIYTSNRVEIPAKKLRKIDLCSQKKSGLPSDIEATLYKNFIVKSTNWSYENEWRLILDGNICKFYGNKIPFPYIKRIYLGCKMDSSIIDTMISIAKDLDIDVHMMYMDEKKFTLDDFDLYRYNLQKRQRIWVNPF
jgi:hypothetical protein